MNRTPGELQETVETSREAFRHWKQLLSEFVRGAAMFRAFLPWML